MTIVALTLSPSAGVEPPSPADPDVPAGEREDPTRQRLRQALRGEPVDDDGTMLGGFIDAMRQRGSVLRGSELDQFVDQSSVGDSPRDGGQASDPSRNERRYRAAEQLLKAARLLRRYEAIDGANRELANQIRAAAVQIMTAPIMTAPITTAPITTAPNSADPASRQSASPGSDSSTGGRRVDKLE